MIKNDFDRPKQKFTVEIGYGYGFVLNAEDIALGIEAGFLEKFGQAGAIFKMGKKELKWQTRKQLYELYEKREPTLKILTSKLIKYAHKKMMDERALKEMEPYKLLITDIHTTKENTDTVEELFGQCFLKCDELGLDTIDVLGDIFTDRVGQTLKTLLSFNRVIKTGKKRKIKLIS